MAELNDDTIRDAWEWLPHGEYGSGCPLFVNYRGAKVNDAHRMAALAGVRWLVEWGDEPCLEHKPNTTYEGLTSYTHRTCPYCWQALRKGKEGA